MDDLEDGSIGGSEVDGDGAPDLLVGDASWDWTGNLRLLRGNGHGGFEVLSRLPDSLADDDHTGFILAFTLFTLFSRVLIQLASLDQNTIRNISFGILLKFLERD